MKRGHACRQTGFTLIEVLVVMALLAIMVTIMTGVLNPVVQVNRANDARRKKDLTDIKVAFESYFNDTGCYPHGGLLTELNSSDSCGQALADFKDYLSIWPCDPTMKKSYSVMVDPSSGNCPHWFKVLAYLENHSDRDVPSGWYAGTPQYLHLGNGQVTAADVNYGVSSTNVKWSDETMLSPLCTQDGACYVSQSGNCNMDAAGGTSNDGKYFTDHLCSAMCEVNDCHGGRPE